MPDTPSLKNRPVYEALRGKGMSKRRAAMISNAQVKKDAGVSGMAIPPTGNNALFNQPGIQSRRRKKKKSVCTCKESLGPGITRIRGNLCNVHGRYGSCDAAVSGSKQPAFKKGRSRRAKKPPKVKLTPEQRQQARDAEHQVNRGKVLQSLNIAPDGQQALEALRQGAQPDPKAIERGGFEAAGLAEQAQDGSYRLTSSGRALIAAANAGDQGRAGDIISAARDRTSARTQRQTEHAKRQQASAAKRQAAHTKREQVAQARAKRMQQRDKKRTTKAETYGGVKRSNLDENVFAGPDRSFPIKTEQDVKDAVRSLGRTKHDKAAVKRGIIRRARAIGAMDALPDDWKSSKSDHLFTVYKDNAGADRWLAITTTAYEDKDREIISTKAIGRAVAFGDTVKERGPLLYWHVPGLPMGDCDFQAQGGPGGRFLIEGGTFRSKSMADLGQTLSASGYQMSPGFIHGDDQPHGGVYDNILIYERSAVPNNRAANYFTRYATAKEGKVLPPEKIAEYREKAANNPEALAMLDTLLTTAQKEDDTAQAHNVVYKDAPEWAQALITRIDGLEATVKAFPPTAAAAVEGSPEEEAAEPADEAMAEGDEQLDDGGGGMDDAAFAQMIAQAVVQALSPLLDMEKKMAGHVNDMKSMVSGIGQQKDDATAAQAQQIAALDAKLKELTGDLPSSVMNGARNFYRASESPLTQLTAQGAATIKEQLSNVPTGITDPTEIAAYQLIFGNS